MRYNIIGRLLTGLQLELCSLATFLIEKSEPVLLYVVHTTTYSRTNALLLFVQEPTCLYKARVYVGHYEFREIYFCRFFNKSQHYRYWYVCS
jgi:hypothetical protein